MRGDDPGPLLARALELAGGDPELERVLRAAMTQVARPAAVLAVAGEYKQGKSELVNALIGQRVCPSDDGFATCAVTVLHLADPPSVRVRRVEGDEVAVELIEAAQLAEYVSDQGNPGNHKRVETAEVGLASPLLEHGITVVDTPGVGGPEPGGSSAVVSFLAVADAVLLVTDASAELTSSELEFLRRVRDLGCETMVALTKTDLYPHWRRIRDLDERHLEAAGFSAEVSPVSGLLHLTGIEDDRPDLREESGVATLAAGIEERVAQGAGARAASRARADVRSVAERMAAPLRAELAALEDPDRAAAARDDLSRARDRLGQLQRAGAQWTVVLQDGMNEIRGEVDYQLRTRMRSFRADIEGLIDEVDPAADWADIEAAVRDGLAGIAQSIQVQIRSDAAALSLRLAALVSDASSQVLLTMQAPRADGDGLDLAMPAATHPGVVNLGLEVLRGSYSGVLLFGFVANLVALPLLGPAALGAGALLGAKQVAEVRKRRVATARQEAKREARRSLEAAALDLNRQMRRGVDVTYRELRDHFVERIDAVLQMHRDSVASLDRAVASGEAERRKRIPGLRRRLVAIEELSAAAAEKEARP